MDPRRHGRRRWLIGGAVVILLVVGSWLISFGQIARQLAPFWQPGRYLVLLENDAELRPTGGFIGSYAVLTINERRWPHLEFDTNIYKLDNAFTATHTIAPPTPLRGIVDRWALRDSNWAIDGSEAAVTVADFYRQETGQSIDGVIGVTAQAGQSLIGRLGSVPLAGGARLTATNFYDTLAYQVEKGYFLTPQGRTTNEPKTVVATLIRSVAIRVLAPWHSWWLPGWLQELLETKVITATFFDPKRQGIVEAQGWANRIDQTSQHFLALNNANLAGGKSSRFMTQTVSLAVTDAEPGIATYQLRLTRTHHGTGVWPDHRNDNLTRIVVPAASTFTAATLDGAPVEPIVTETTANRSVVGFRIDTDPGTSRSFVATIRVPVDPALSRSFTWQKQPGVASDDVTVSVNGRTILSGAIDRDRTVEVPVDQ